MSKARPLRYAVVVGEQRLQAAIDETVLQRMARRQQALAISTGLKGPVQVTLSVLPQRGSSDFADALRWELRRDGFVFVSQQPVTCLEPAVISTALTAQGGNTNGQYGPIRYLVECPADPSPHWYTELSQVRAVGLAPVPPSRSLFPSRAHPCDVVITIRQHALNDALEWCRGPVEKGGILLGYLRGQPGGLWAEVLAFTPAAEGTVADEHHIHFGGAAWQSMYRRQAEIERDMELDDPLQVLGWVHSHVSRKPEMLMFSARDRATMAQYFSEPWCLALVCLALADPNLPPEQRLAAFGWDEHGVGVIPRDILVMDGV